MKTHAAEKPVVTDTTSPASKTTESHPPTRGVPGSSNNPIQPKPCESSWHGMPAPPGN